MSRSGYKSIAKTKKANYKPVSRITTSEGNKFVKIVSLLDNVKFKPHYIFTTNSVVNITTTINNKDKTTTYENLYSSKQFRKVLGILSSLAYLKPKISVHSFLHKVNNKEVYESIDKKDYSFSELFQFVADFAGQFNSKKKELTFDERVICDAFDPFFE